MADEKTVKAASAEDTKKDAKAKQPAKKKAKGRIGNYFKELRGEFKKIIWLPFSGVARNTGVTLAVCAILGIVICLIDAGLSGLIQLLVNAVSAT